jgi:hypothetical protein
LLEGVTGAPEGVNHPLGRTLRQPFESTAVRADRIGDARSTPRRVCGSLDSAFVMSAALIQIM